MSHVILASDKTLIGLAIYGGDLARNVNMVFLFHKTGQRLKMRGWGLSTWQFWFTGLGHEFGRWHAISNMCKNRRTAERCSITTGHHRFGAFLESVQATTEATRGPRNHVGTAMIANHLESIRGTIEGTKWIRSHRHRGFSFFFLLPSFDRSERSSGTTKDHRVRESPDDSHSSLRGEPRSWSKMYERLQTH